MLKRISIFLAGLLLVCSCVKTPEAEFYGKISGLVKDSQTDRLLNGVKVTLSPGGKSQMTSTDGTFHFEELEPAEYTISFSKDGYNSESQKVKVNPGADASVHMSMTPVQPKLSVSATNLDFGENRQTLSIDITNTGKGTLEWVINEKIDWIECEPGSGTTTEQVSTVVVSVLRDKLNQGNYRDSFVISSNGGSQTITVSASVKGITLRINPSELDFGKVQSSIPMTLENTGNGTISWSAETSNGWLSLSKASGVVSTTDNVKAVVSRDGLSAGQYDGTITFTVAGNTTAIPVTMEVAVNEKPQVTIESYSNLTTNSIQISGTLVSTGSAEVTRYGVCWGTSSSPSVGSGNFTNLGDTMEAKSFESIVTGLQSSTKYYFRTYAENSVGISYSSNSISVTTKGMPAKAGVTTGNVTEITGTSASVSGSITDVGNTTVTAYGHVWGTMSQPVLESGKYTQLSTTEQPKSFNSELTDLEQNTTYYVRAYATNEMGTSYGSTVSFSTTKDESLNPTNGLYVYYTFENNCSNSYGSGPSASATNSPTYVTGIGGSKAIKLNASKGSYINIPESMLDGSAFTISFWAKDLSDGHIFHVNSTGQYYVSNVLTLRNGALTYMYSGYYLWYQYGNQSESPSFSHGSLSGSTWHMITLTSNFYSGLAQATQKLYIDGEFCDIVVLSNQGTSTSNKGVKLVFGGPLSVSGYSQKLDAVNMTVDNLRIYKSRELSADEIKDLYNYEK